MHPFRLFIFSLLFIAAFNAVLILNYCIIRFIERRRSTFSYLHRTWQYKRYHKNICVCLAFFCLVEIILLGSSWHILHRKIMAMCDTGTSINDCTQVANLWHTATWILYGVAALVLIILISCLVRSSQQDARRSSIHSYQPLNLALGHALLQICGVLMLIVTSSDVVFANAKAGKARDACVAMAITGISTFESGVALWIFGTVGLWKDVSLQRWQRNASEDEFLQDEILLDEDDDGF